MNQVDNISRMLGEMTADIKYIKQVSDKTGTLLTEINAKTIVHEEIIKGIQPKVENHEAVKNKVIGWAAAVAGVVTTGITFVIDFIHNLY